MFLIDGPYLSDFMIETITRSAIAVYDTAAAREMLNVAENDAGTSSNAKGGIIWGNEIKPDTRLYTNSESALAHLPAHSAVAPVVSTFKDKFKFREFLSEIDTDFDFKEFTLEELETADGDDLNYPCVMKPSVGFLSVDVFVLENVDDFKAAKDQILSTGQKSPFPPAVLQQSRYIIESYVHGEEYAADYYVDNNGDVVIMNLLHHRFSGTSDTSDRLYSASLELIETLGPKVRSYLQNIADKFGVTGLPGHAEFRISDSGRITLIEINPLRFGGWCTSGDLLGVCLGFNAYLTFFADEKPVWADVFATKEDKVFTMAVLDNNSGVSPDQIERFDTEKFLSDYPSTVELRSVSDLNYGVLGFAFLETDSSSESQLDSLLVADMGRYIVRL